MIDQVENVIEPETVARIERAGVVVIVIVSIVVIVTGETVIVIDGTEIAVIDMIVIGPTVTDGTGIEAEALVTETVVVLMGIKVKTKPNQNLKLNQLINQNKNLNQSIQSSSKMKSQLLLNRKLQW